MKKHIIFGLLAAVLLWLCCGIALGDSSGSCGDGVNWDLAYDGGYYTLTISGNGVMADYKTYDNAAPWKAHSSSIRSVVVQDGVSYIGANTFYGCGSLKSVSLSASVAEIRDGAFGGGCWNLSTITVNGNSPFFSVLDGILYDKNQKTLKYCPMTKTSVTIPDGVTTIGDRAFYGNNRLQNITIPDSLVSIGKEAFAECYSLYEITLPAGLRTIGSGTLLKITRE